MSTSLEMYPIFYWVLLSSALFFIFIFVFNLFKDHRIIISLDIVIYYFIHAY